MKHSEYLSLRAFINAEYSSKITRYSVLLTIFGIVFLPDPNSFPFAVRPLIGAISGLISWGLIKNLGTKNHVLSLLNKAKKSGETYESAATKIYQGMGSKVPQETEIQPA